MPSLLKSLQSALAKVNGNTITTDDDRGYDEFYCRKCKGRVYEDQFNFMKCMCYQCWYDLESEE